MRMVALMGSPRKGGNTDVLTDECLRGASQAGAQVEKVYLDDLHIRPIGDVGEVPSAQRTDARHDDDFPRALGRFLAADVVVLSSPDYWLGVSAQLKCFIDRLSCYFRVPAYEERFDGKGYLVIGSFGRPDPDHGRWITEPLKVCVDVLRGRYLGDLYVSVPSPVRGRVRENVQAMQAAFDLGRQAVRQFAAGSPPRP